MTTVGYAATAQGRAIRGVGLLLVIVGLTSLAGCSSVPSLSDSLPSLPSFSSASKKKIDDEKKPAGLLYGEADALLGKADYEAAAKKFETVDRLYPYSPFARRAMVMAAFGYYKAEKYPEAIQAGKRYTALHPGTKEAAFAHHIVAMSYFDQINDPARDQRLTQRAYKQFSILVRRYPESKYAKLAANRIRITEDTLAAAEMNVGRYYLKRNNYLAAINRFKTVVTKYQTTQQVEEALMRLTEAYMAIGIKQEAQTAAAILGHNFPESKWYKDAYTLLKSDGLAPREDTGSSLSRAWRDAIKGVRKISPI